MTFRRLAWTGFFCAGIAIALVVFAAALWFIAALNLGIPVLIALGAVAFAMLVRMAWQEAGFVSNEEELKK